MVSCCSAQAPASGVQTGHRCRSYCHIGTGLQDTFWSQATENIKGPVWANPAEIKGAGAVYGTAVSGRKEILPNSVCSQRPAEESIRTPCDPSLATGFQSGNTGDTRDGHPKEIP